MRSRRITAALCLVALLPGCTTWATPQPTPPGPDRGRVRVTTLDGESVVLRDPFIAGERYVGRTTGGGEWTSSLDSIRSFEVEDFQEGRTVLTVVAATAALLTALIFIMPCEGMVCPG